MKGKTLGLTLLALGAALALAACGGGGGYGGEGGGATTASGGSGGAYASHSGQSASSGGATATVAVGTAAGAGKVLVTSEGMTLYYFEKDKKGSGASTCSGACASGWPPLTTEGAPKAAGEVKASMLGTIERSDGTMQVTYAGWPLYTYVADTQPGEDNGTDSHAFGAAWYPIHPNGEKAGE